MQCVVCHFPNMNRLAENIHIITLVCQNVPIVPVCHCFSNKHKCTVGGMISVTVIEAGNGVRDQRSNLGQSCFVFLLMRKI